jgi:hypothetical protein
MAIRLFPIATALLGAILSSNVAFAAPAARVVYAFGQVNAVDGQGSARALERGASVYSGDTVQTQAGRTQIRFTDGGFAALQPNTRYKVEDYAYTGQADGSERGFFNLLKGTVRLVTGAIGHANRSNFRLSTKVATIGIRGTAGVIQTCDGDCAGKEDGTYLSGYGGVWDLQSGDYSGEVASGESYHCDGAECQKLEGPSGNRADVSDDEALVEKEKEEAPGVQENAVAQGNQVGEDGVLCDLGGGCGEFTVLADQVGTAIFDDETGSVGDFDVVLLGGRPIASIATLSLGDGGETFRFTEINTTSVDQIRALVSTIDDGFREERLALLAQVDPELESLLNANPAELAAKDFGTDGVLTYGRFVDGHLLNFTFFEFIDANGSAEAEFESELLTLSGFQSWHFIYGADPGPVASSALASYVFSGGTFSTSVSGATIGDGVTAGRLDWDFLLGEGALSMTVSHAGFQWLVDGSLRADLDVDDRAFFDDDVTASGKGGTVSAEISGFFAGPSKGGVPIAAGLNYVLEDSDPIIGVAGFGLESIGASSGQAALPLGAVVTFAENASDSSSTQLMNGIAGATGIDGVNAAGVTTGGVLRGLISTPFIVDATQATVVEAGNLGGLGASWARLRDNLVTLHPALSPTTSRVGDLHLAYTTQPTLTLPGVGSFTYGTSLGGTTPTMNRAGDGTTYTGTHSVSVAVDFAAGVLFNFAVSGSVPGASASYSMSTSNVESIVAGQPTTFSIVAGDPGDAGSFNSPLCTSCPVNGSAQMIFAGPSAAALVGSYGATAIGGNAGESVSGTFVIGP